MTVGDEVDVFMFGDINIVGVCCYMLPDVPSLSEPQSILSKEEVLFIGTLYLHINRYQHITIG